MDYLLVALLLVFAWKRWRTIKDRPKMLVVDRKHEVVYICGSPMAAQKFFENRPDGYNFDVWWRGKKIGSYTATPKRKL